MTTRIWTWVAAAAALGLAACGSDSNGSAAPPATPPPATPAPTGCTPPTTPTATFTQAQTILVSKCGTCHGSAFGSTDRTTAYNAAKARVDVTNPDNSVLIQKGDARVAHGGGDQLDPAQVTSITAWVRECAQNN